MELEHLSGYLLNCDEKFISDFNRLYKMVLELVDLIEMEILSPPRIVREEEPFKGNTIFCIIKTSHIAFHFMENDKELTRFTIDSCKLFDKEKVMKFLGEIGEVKIKSEY